ncbi:MAG: type II toxin-antitoxin system HicA family toxin [Patescibacteria group bacterium]
MPLPNIKSDSNQRKILKAFKKLGFEILPTGFGKGSHRLVKDPRSGKEITVQHNIYKQVIRDYCKKVEQLDYDAEKFIKSI